MKYLVNDIKKTGLFVNEFDNKEEAIKYAKYDFDHMSKTDQEASSEYYVLESVNSDEDAENHYDGDVIYRLK